MKTKKTRTTAKKASRFRPAFIVALLTIAGASIFQIACGDDDNAVKETLDSGQTPPTTDTGTPDGGGSDAPGDSDCFLDPHTHFEIINACTDATRIDKNPVLTKLLPDGGLPPVQ